MLDFIDYLCYNATLEFDNMRYDATQAIYAAPR